MRSKNVKKVDIIERQYGVGQLGKNSDCQNLFSDKVIQVISSFLSSLSKLLVLYLENP